ncbi:MAG: hypothetical protein OXD43_03260 [Bacteroidetes bacterium]|nr:hypothetical protein [Bacteroidota bacterium]
MKKYSINPMRTGVLAAIVFFFLPAGCQIQLEEEDAISEDVTDAVSADDEATYSGDENGDEDFVAGEEIESIAQGLEDLLGGESGEGLRHSPINWRELEELLPNRLNGLSLNVTEGQTVDIGAGFSSVSGQYEDEEQEITIVIADPASLSEIAAYAMSDWIGEEIDKESDRGFERTNIFRSRKGEYPSYEKYHQERGHESCELHSWVADRFLIAISGDSVSMSVCEEARDEISFRRLERLAEADD